MDEKTIYKIFMQKEKEIQGHKKLESCTQSEWNKQYYSIFENLWAGETTSTTKVS
jgi:hypothetical protein